MARLVLTDSSPLIGLERVNGIDWLRELFGEVQMTASVRRELGTGASLEKGILGALEDGWLVVRDDEPSGAQRPPHLGDGEWQTVLAAREHDGEVLILLDDRLVRREARSHGLRVAGTAAIVAMAQRRGIIESAREVFERLIQIDFRIAPEVIRAALDEVETS